MKQLSQEFKSSLRKAGLDRTQVEVFSSLLGAGLLSIQDLAKSVGLPRSSVHLATEELIERGVVLVHKQGKRRLFYIDTPERIRSLVEFDQNILNERKSILEQTLPELNAIFATEKGEEPIVVEELHGEDGFVKTFYSSLEGKHSEVLRLGGDPEKFTVARDRLADYRKLRMKKGIKSMILMPDSPMTDSEKLDAIGKGREVRSLPREIYNPEVQASIFGDIACFTVWDSGLHSITIKNSKIASLLKSLYKIAWEQAK